MFQIAMGWAKQRRPLKQHKSRRKQILSRHHKQTTPAAQTAGVGSSEVAQVRADTPIQYGFLSSVGREQLAPSYAVSPELGNESATDSGLQNPVYQFPDIMEDSLYVDHGFVYNSYQQGMQAAMDPNNSWVERGVNFGLATLTWPLAMAEEYVGRPMANIPHDATMGGRYLARANMQTDPDQKVIDYLNATVSLSGAFVGAGDFVAPGVFAVTEMRASARATAEYSNLNGAQVSDRAIALQRSRFRA
ncbi:MAG: hypothetical protein P8179_24575 [Candidatus Thiodiazotropha sp.]